MRRIVRSTTLRLAAAAGGSALIAAALMLANPFPFSVQGQTVPSTSIAPGTAVSPATSAPATVVSPVTAAPPATGVAPVVGAQTQAITVTQQPAALPRTGAGLGADSSMSVTGTYGLLALAAGVGSVAVVLRSRRAR